MEILAIDPGNEYSAWVRFDTVTGMPVAYAKEPNDVIMSDIIEQSDVGYLAIEMIKSYGMAVGEDVFQTCIWIGRFAQAWKYRWQVLPTYIPRRDIKLHICGQSKANDANIRTELIDRYGGKLALAKGQPLHGMAKDTWAALALAITFAETRIAL